MALLDGPIHTGHPCLSNSLIHQASRIAVRGGNAERHATFAASTLVGTGGQSMGLINRCTLFSIPVMDEAFASGQLDTLEAARRVASGIAEAVRQRVDVLQLSLAFDPEQGRACEAVVSALKMAAAHGIVAIVAAGNSTHLGPNPVLQVPAVVGVMAADASGCPLAMSVMSPAVGRRGLLAPGFEVPGAIPPSSMGWSTGSSVAACFVTAAFAMLRCCFPTRSPAEIISA
ncbi:MAG TPA: S8 family serine peptidase, partial [Verrucomicrobiae bacterium]